MLNVKRMHSDAKLPTVAHPGEDMAYDIYALNDFVLRPGIPSAIRTGIAVQAFTPSLMIPRPLGLLIRDRSSMAAKAVIVSAGVVDHGYTGEIKVVLTYTGPGIYDGKAGDKIAQMIPLFLLTGPVCEVTELSESARGADGFGSTGR